MRTVSKLPFVMLPFIMLVIGCTAEVPAEGAPFEIVTEVAVAFEDPHVNDCSPDEGLEVDAAGEVVHGITQCAICRRFEEAYERRAAELGCEAPYPLDGCPIDVGGGDCLVHTVESWADGSWATDCAMLERWFGQLETYGGFLCGDACTITDPYAVPVTSTVVQEPRPISSPSWGLDWCCPETPYALRERCPFWCQGPDECGWAECRALYDERMR